MLWMITDFLKTPSVSSAESAICKALGCGVDKVSLRNGSVFKKEEVFSLACRIEKRFPEKEVFIHDMAPVEFSGYKYFHFPSSKIEDAINCKKQFKNIVTAVSTHSEQEFSYAFSRGVDYALFSPVFRPLSKPDDNRKTIMPLFLKNLYLLGGIDRMRGKMLVYNGYTNIAGVSLFYGDDAQKNILELASLIREKENEFTYTN